MEDDGTKLLVETLPLETFSPPKVYLEGSRLLKDRQQTYSSSEHPGPKTERWSGKMEKKDVLWYSIFWLGMGTLVGWNSLLAAVDFFRFSFKHSPSAAVWFTWVFELATLVTLGFLSTHGEQYSFSFRFKTGFCIVTAVLILIPVSITMLSEHVAWGMTIVLVSILAFGSGITEGSLYGFAAAVSSGAGQNDSDGSTDATFATPAQAGQGFAGVLVCFIRIASKAAFTTDPGGARSSGAVFFGVSALITSVCSFLGSRIAADLPPVHVDDALAWNEKTAVVKKVAQYALAQVCINGVTMAVFPAMATSPGKSTNGLTSGWLTVILVTEYSVADTVGNLVGMGLLDWCFQRLPKGVMTMQTLTYWASLSRIIFIPLFMMLAAEKVKSDALAMALTVALGFTNGALSVVCMEKAPGAFVASGEGREREHASYAMVVALLLGVTLGATVAIPLNLLVLNSPH